MKFDAIYQEALVNMATPTQPAATTPATANAATAQKPKLDQAKLGLIAQKWQKAKASNQPLNLNPDEMEALGQLLGGNDVQPQTNTPPVVQTPQAANKPQVGTTNTPAI